MKTLAEIMTAGDQKHLNDWLADHPPVAGGPGLYSPPSPPSENERIRAALSGIGTPPLYDCVKPSPQPPKRGRLYTGKPGTGKTHTAIADGLALRLAGKNTRWLSLPAYMAAVRSHEPIPPLAHLRALDVLILDDIAQAKPPEWMRETLYSLIDGLLNHRVLVIATSNCDRVEIAKTYGDPIASRLAALCRDTITVTGHDRRLFE